MQTFSTYIRSLREKKGCSLRVVSDALGIDQAVLSKIETGKRKATRVQVLKFAKYFKVKQSDLLVLWLSDTIAKELKRENVTLDVLQVSEEKVEYRKHLKINKPDIIKKIKAYFKKDGRVIKGWIFGSFARGDFNTNSDIDLMVRFKEPGKISLFDFADIAFWLEKQTGLKVDLVEEGCLKPYAWETAKNDIMLIYG